MRNNKILCPFHREATASCVLYSNGFFCFGCGARGKLSELKGVRLPPLEELEPEPPEDLEATYRYIDTLPRTQARGLEFPADNKGFYVTWPDRDYYKLRLWEPGNRPKYLGARGHRKPPFWGRRDGYPTLAVVEGEINAMSVAKACRTIDVLSPGGVGDFTEKKVKFNLQLYYKYSTILVIADADAPGCEAIINMLAVLWASGLKAIGMPMQRDANEWFQDDPKALREEVEKKLKENVATGP